jgi:hypothetical protein
MRKRGVLLGLIALVLPLILTTSSPIASAAIGDTDSAVTLNGTNNVLSVTDSAFGYRSAFTIQGWIRPTEVNCANSCTIFSHDADYIISIVSGTYQLWQYYNYNQITSQLNTGVVPRLNEWQHVAYTYSSGAQKFYLNGQLVWSNTIAGWSSNPTFWSNYPFKLGYHYGSSYFYGDMDEVRLYSTTRSESEIAGDMHRWGPANSSGLIAYYDMNDISGSTVTNKVTGATSATTLTMSGTLSQTTIESVTTTSGFTTISIPRSYLNSAGGYKIPLGVSSLQLLAVGGGGGGGFDGGGGGGGGGVYQNSILTVTENSYYEVDIGAGGRGTTGYLGGSGFCNGSWNGTIVGCSGGTGGTTKFGTITASGGGGGGGIEANGLGDSDASATVRGGGGGAGGQNGLVGVTAAGVGAFSGGGTTDGSGNSGGGGASGVANGSNGNASSAGNGATGTTATLTGIVYGSGGAGGNFSTATLATGGSGAANGGTSQVGPTTPAVNRGGGGAGGGNGGVAANAKGTSGASGVLILKWALRGSASLTFSSTPIFRTSTTLTATTNTASKVTFLANNKRIPGCISRTTSANVATCNWKPSTRGTIVLTLQITPSDSNYAATRVDASTFFATKRTGNR